MTLEEVLIQFEKHSLCDSLGFSDEDDVVAMELAVITIKKAIKYRWHDLRENPKDLPDSNRFVEVRTEDSFPYYFGWYDTESEFDMWYDAIGFQMQPYKWREIEEEAEE